MGAMAGMDGRGSGDCGVVVRAGAGRGAWREGGARRRGCALRSLRGGCEWSGGDKGETYGLDRRFQCRCGSVVYLAVDLDVSWTSASPSSSDSVFARAVALGVQPSSASTWVGSAEAANALVSRNSKGSRIKETHPLVLTSQPLSVRGLPFSQCYTPSHCDSLEPTRSTRSQHPVHHPLSHSL
jgi:hypothetical protein